MSTPFKNHLSALRLIAAMLPLLLLSGCFEPDTAGVGYTAFNHTDKSIVSIIVNGQGGVAHATAHGGGSEVCCVVIPRKWQQGLKAVIKWQEAGTYKRDSRGNEILENGVPVLIKAPWNEKTVEIHEYDENLGQFQIHFFPGAKIEIVVSNLMPGHPKYPLQLPKPSN